MGFKCIFICLFLSSVALHAQIARHQQLTMDNGLSHHNVFVLLQDRGGFIWIGTEDSLCKYDGYSFTVFRHDPNDTLSLSSNKIRSLYEDQDGVLWVGTFYGLNRNCVCG